MTLYEQSLEIHGMGRRFLLFFRNGGYEFSSHTKKEKRKLKNKRKIEIGEGRMSKNKSISER